MITGYVRVSTDKQATENQVFELKQFAEKNGVTIDTFVEETVSGTVKATDRKLGSIIKDMKKGDVIICAEISRLGRNLYMIMSILNELMNRDIQVWTAKEGYKLGNDLSSQVLAFAFSLSAQIERNLISARTKEALQRKKAEGVKLGRPIKDKPTSCLSEDAERIYIMLEDKSKSAVAKELGVSRQTLHKFLKNNSKV